jgi:S1-C subfamily serine protease
MTLRRYLPPLAAWVALAFCLPAVGADLSDAVRLVKPSVVAIGSYVPTRRPALIYSGTGWVTGDGLSVITNSHVWPEPDQPGGADQWGIVSADGDQVRFRALTLAARDRRHDLVHLRLSGAPLPALVLADSSTAREGMELGFTGFPLGMTLGLNPATHHATLAAITTMTTPAPSARQLDAGTVRRLHQDPVVVFQLDGTAYPGNSGSPLFDPASGTVLGVVNMVLVKAGRDSALSAPSGIAYAIPANYVRALLQSTRP